MRAKNYDGLSVFMAPKVVAVNLTGQKYRIVNPICIEATAESFITSLDRIIFAYVRRLQVFMVSEIAMTKEDQRCLINNAISR